MACIVMVYSLCSSGLYGYGLYKYGLYRYGVCSYDLYGYGRNSYGLYSYGVFSYGTGDQPFTLPSDPRRPDPQRALMYPCAYTSPGRIAHGHGQQASLVYTTWSASSRSSTSVNVSVRTCLHDYMRACVRVCMRAYVHVCMRAYVHAYVHACMCAYVHACVCAYVRTRKRPPSVSVPLLYHCAPFP